MNKIMNGLIASIILIAIQSHSLLAAEGITVDFKIGPRNHILVPVSINSSQDKNFAFDTGAGVTALNEKRLDGMALDESKYERVMIGRAYSNTQTYLAPLDSVRFAGLERDNIKAVLTDLTNVEHGVVKLDGVLGFDFFGDYDLSIDYAKKQLSLNPQINGQSCNNVSGTPFEYVAGRMIKVELTIADKTIPAVLDTGASFSAMNSAAANTLSPGATEMLKEMMAVHGVPENHDGEEFFVGRVGLDKIVLGDHSIKVKSQFNVIDLPVFEYFDMVTKPGLLIGGDLLKDKVVNISYGCQKIEII